MSSSFFLKIIILNLSNKAGFIANALTVRSVRSPVAGAKSDMIVDDIDDDDDDEMLIDEGNNKEIKHTENSMVFEF